MERIITHRLTTHLSPRLSPYQHGFRPTHSTLDALHTLIRTIHNKQKAATGAVFIDFSKAFDRVDHGRILARLHELQVDTFICRWVRNFLTDRTSRVRADHFLTHPGHLTCGVPKAP